MNTVGIIQRSAVRLDELFLYYFKITGVARTAVAFPVLRTKLTEIFH